MCVVILSVLGEHATRIGVDSRTTEQWLHSYIGKHVNTLVRISHSHVAALQSYSSWRRAHLGQVCLFTPGSRCALSRFPWFRISYGLRLLTPVRPYPSLTNSRTNTRKCANEIFPDCQVSVC